MSVLRHPLYSPTIMQHFTSPRHEGVLERPDAQGWSGSAAKPHLAGVQLKLKMSRIAAARFTLQERTPLMVAAGSVLCQWVRGQVVDTAVLFTLAGLTTRMGGIPDHMHHEVALVFEAFQQAVSNAVEVLKTAPAGGCCG